MTPICKCNDDCCTCGSWGNRKPRKSSQKSAGSPVRTTRAFIRQNSGMAQANLLPGKKVNSATQPHLPVLVSACPLSFHTVSHHCPPLYEAGRCSGWVERPGVMAGECRVQSIPHQSAMSPIWLLKVSVPAGLMARPPLLELQEVGIGIGGA